MSISKWDHYSDQPHIIKDKRLKREIYKKSIFELFKILFLTIALSPFILISYIFIGFKKREVDLNEIFSMGVSLENDSGETLKLLNELNIKNILIRFPLNKIDDIDRYREFIDQFKDYNILINIIQTRSMIEDKRLLEESLREVFLTFRSVKEYQIGTTINRKKWGFFKLSEYFKFFKVAKDLRDREFKHIELIGPSVIDFEYHFNIYSLFNFYNIFFDSFSTLLYVDRRGSPFNTQIGFDLYKKIKLLASIMLISPKTSNRLYITETNWPLKDTAPYAPTSEKECVDPKEYADFMVAYYLIAIASGYVKRVYWHQLIARGYGLVDNIDGLKKYPSFYAFVEMCNTLNKCKFISFNIDSTTKKFYFSGDKCDIIVTYDTQKPPGSRVEYVKNS
jgi:hypothetical protein